MSGLLTAAGGAASALVRFRARWTSLNLGVVLIFGNNNLDPRRSGLMKRYCFDIIEGDEIFPDEEGLELSTLEKVQEEAARSLADLVRDAVRTRGNGHSHLMAIEVREESGPILHV